jgi:hypothetical protein
VEPTSQSSGLSVVCSLSVVVMIRRYEGDSCQPRHAAW